MKKYIKKNSEEIVAQINHVEYAFIIKKAENTKKQLTDIQMFLRRTDDSFPEEKEAKTIFKYLANEGWLDGEV